MSRYRDSCPLDCKVYVGDLGNSGTKHEIEEAFSYYGPLRSVWVARNPPGFAFVEFEDTRDARDASRALDGKVLCGRRVRVELSTGKSRHSFRGPPPRPFHPEDRCYDCGERGHYARDCKRVSRRYRGGTGGSSRSRRSRSRSRSHGGGGGGRSQSRSHSRSRSRSRSPRGGSRSRSASGSRTSRSPKDYKERRMSPQHSPSRSPRNSPEGRNGDVD